MVQNYFNRELSDVIFEVEALDEWKELSGKLGLEQQLSFVKGKNSPVPYPFLTESLKRIFKTLCPTVNDYKQYNKTPIPLEVLRQISLCINDKYFNKIEIWYDDKKSDPVVMGTIEKYYGYDAKYQDMKDDLSKRIVCSSQEEVRKIALERGFALSNVTTSETNSYIVARWGDELRPEKELQALAKQRLIEKYGAEMTKEVTQLSGALKVLDENCSLYLQGEITENQIKGKAW